MLRTNQDSPQQGDASATKIFLGVHFALLGFNDTEEANVRSKLVDGGGVEVGEYSPKCNHLIVDKIVYDDPRCVVARNNGKIVVTAWWVDQSLDVGMLDDTNSVLYRPVKDLNGIPGAKSLCVCLTGYQRQDREDIMRMVDLMGGHFSKPLVANKVTHLICYKFEGEKYELAKRMKRAKLVNHRWLEDCLKAWKILPECNYNKCGYELETMEAEAKDSEEETEEDANAAQFEKSVAGEPSHFPSGSGKECELPSKRSPFPTVVSEVPTMHQNPAACKSLSDKTMDVDERRLLTTPQRDRQFNEVAEFQFASREGSGELAQHERVLGFDNGNNEPSSDPRTVDRTPYSNAAKSSAQSYSRKTPRTSLDSKSLGTLSTHLHGSPHGDLEQYKIKDGIDTSTSKLEQLNRGLVFGGIESPRSGSDFHRGEGSGTMPRKRNPSLSIPNSRSATKANADTKACATGSAPVSAGAEPSIIGTPHKKSSPFRLVEESFDQIDRNSTGNQSTVFPKINSSSSKKYLKQGLSILRNAASNTTECPPDLARLDITTEKKPEKLSVELELSNLPKVGNGEKSRPTAQQIGKTAAPQTPRISPPCLGNHDIDKSETHVNLIGQIGMSNETSPKLARKSTASKKTLGSRSKLSASSTKKQKGSLCLDRAVNTVEAKLDLGQGDEEAANEVGFSFKPENTSPTPKADINVEQKVTAISCSERNFKKNVESVGDETEAPEEDIAKEFEKADGKEMAELIAKEDLTMDKKLEATLSANEMERDVGSGDKTAVALLEDGANALLPVNRRRKTELGSKVSGGKKKGIKCNSSKKEKNAAPAMEAIGNSSEGTDGVKLGEKSNDGKVGAETAKVVQRRANKLKATSLSVDETEKPISGVELEEKSNDGKVEVEKAVVQHHANKFKTTSLCKDEKEKAMGGVDFGEKSNDGNFEVEKEKVMQHHGNKSKTTSMSVHETEKPMDVVKLGTKTNNENLEVQNAKVLRDSANKPKNKSVSEDKTEKHMDAKRGDKHEDPIKGNKRKRNSEPGVKEKEISDKEHGGELEEKIEDEKMEVDKVKGVQHPQSKLKRKTETNDNVDEPLNAVQETLKENGGRKIGRKQLPSKKKSGTQSVAKEIDATSKDTAEVDLEREANGEKLDPNKVKVQKPATKPKSEGLFKNKAEKSQNAEKENTPIRNETPVASLGKRMREVASKLVSKSNKKPVNTCHMDSEANPGKAQPSTCSNLLKSEPVWFIVSGHRLQRKEFQQVIRRLRGRICRDSHHWSYQATHFIVPDPVKRTEKFFAAAASGRWILKTDYLAASNQAGKFLPEEPYEWFKNSLSEDGAINLEAPRKWRLLRERTGHGAFFGMRIIVYGECIAPSLDTLKRVVKAGDGTILATSPPYSRFLTSGVDFAVVGPGMPLADLWVQEFRKHEIPCVMADYLVEYVCKPGYSLERHVLYETYPWAERSVANLLSRSEEIVEASTPSDDSSNEDICCQVCGSNDREEIMLICGDETGSTGCGIGMHIDCCDPPLQAVPDGDWFCPKCNKSRTSRKPSKGSKKK